MNAKTEFDKPIYVCADMSSTYLKRVYMNFYEYMTPLFHENCKVMYTDTDNLIYHVKCDDIYNIIKCDINRFDTSDYDRQCL